MRIGMLMLVPMLMLVAAGPAAVAATPATAPTVTGPAASAFTIQGKVLRLARGRFEVQVMRVEQAVGVKVGEKLWIRETAKTKVLQAGKPAAVAMLKVGARVEISGTVKKSRKASEYDAATIQIEMSR